MTLPVIVLFCCCMLFALVQLLTEEGSFAPISCFRWRSWLSYGFPNTCGRFFCSLLYHLGLQSWPLLFTFTLWTYPSAPLADLHICLGFRSLRFHPIFEPGLVFWIFFFLTLSTVLYVWCNSNTSHHKCHAIMTEILLLLEWNL